MGTEVISNNEEIVVKPENTEKPTELEQKIIRQIEYYFGDFNLRKDRFLKGELENDNGWVPLETLIKFNRLKQLSEDFSVITEALKKSPNQLMEVNEDCTKVRRIAPLLDTSQDDRDERTLYVKGFKKDMKLDELLDFFQEYKTEHITMRKHKQGNKLLFKGSVFATFKTKEDCDAFFEQEVKYNKVSLHKERKKEYMKRKDEFYDKLREEKKQKDKEKSANIKKEIENMKANSQGFEKGCLLRVIGLAEDSERDKIKETFAKYGNVAFVDYHFGNEKGIIRFEKGVASDVLKDAVEEDGEMKLQIDDIKVTVSLIEGEEEEQYFENILKLRANSKFKGNTKYGNKGRFNKKNRGKRQKNNREEEDEQPAAKRRKSDLTEEVDGISKKNSDSTCDSSKESVEKKTTDAPDVMDAE